MRGSGSNGTWCSGCSRSSTSAYEVHARKQPTLFVPSLLEAGGQEAFEHWRGKGPLNGHVLGYCLGPAVHDGADDIFILGICFFQCLQTILARTMEPQPLAAGGHDLANERLTSYFTKSGAAILVKYDMDRDWIFVLARPVHEECSHKRLVSLLESVSKKVLDLVAIERKAVAVAKKILPPLCAKVVDSDRLEHCGQRGRTLLAAWGRCWRTTSMKSSCASTATSTPSQCRRCCRSSSKIPPSLACQVHEWES